jgi:hypothetical protein
MFPERSPENNAFRVAPFLLSRMAGSRSLKYMLNQAHQPKSKHAYPDPQ